GVEMVQFPDGQIGDLQLPLAQDAQDHGLLSPPAGSPAADSIALGGGAPAPSSAFIRASSASTLAPELNWSSWAWMSPPGVAVTSSRAPEAISSSTAPARAWRLAVLSSARWMAMPTSP